MLHRIAVIVKSNNNCNGIFRHLVGIIRDDMVLIIKLTLLQQQSQIKHYAFYNLKVKGRMVT